MRGTHVRLSWFMLGVVLLQAAWIWVLPPFGGMDEIDHSYRAASVARGHLTDRARTSRGRGDLILVPSDIVAAAHHRCVVLPYTRFANCNRVGPPNAAGEVPVASAAARYNPLFYMVVGAVSRPFHGSAVSYALRIAGALLCDAFLAAGFWISLRRSPSAWPVRALLVAATPVLLCATATAAPNGLQMSASLALWTAGAALAKGRRLQRAPERRLLIGIAISLCVVVVSHTTGLVWGPAACVALLLAMGRLRVDEVWASHRRLVLMLGAAVTATTVFAASWVVTQRTNDPAAESSSLGRLPIHQLFIQPLLWAFQTIGAVPFRNQPAPPVVFALGLLLFLFFVYVGARKADRRVRGVVAAIGAVCLVVPLAATVATYSRVGFAWQGRYELPLAYGLLVLAAWSLPADFPRRLGRAVTPLVVAATVVMQGASILHVQSVVRWSPLDGGRAPSDVVLVGLVALSGVALLFALRLEPETAPARSLEVAPRREAITA